MSEFCQISETVHLEISEDVNNFPTADELIRWKQILHEGVPTELFFLILMFL